MNYKEIFEEYLENYNFPKSFSKYIKYCISDGQRIRPQLLLVWCDLYGGDVTKALPAALAVELIHTASLIQDDLPCMDNEKIRRNKNALYLEFGQIPTILCSNVLISLSFSLIEQLNIKEHKKKIITQILSEAINEMSSGQLLELTTKELTIENWHDIYKQKTASLLGAACEIGAIIAEANSKEIYKAKEYGYYLGIGYQLADDLQDKDGMYNLSQEDKILELLESYVDYIFIKEEDEVSYQSIFLNSLVKEALLKNN